MKGTCPIFRDGARYCKKATRAPLQKQTFSLGRKEALFTIVFELNQDKKYSIKSLCESLKISRSGYYKWLNKSPSAQELRAEEIAKEIQRIFKESQATFGVVRMYYALKRERNWNVNKKAIRRIMRRLHLLPEIRKKRPNWINTAAVYTADNIIQRNFEASGPNEKWFTDVSYIFYGKREKAYISAIIDRYDLSIVSYIISQKNDNKLVMDTIKLAMERNHSVRPIIHSDRGYQYTSLEYKRLTEHYDFDVSMSRPGKCLDNQPIESFWGVLKSEYYYRNRFSTFEELQSGIGQYIDYYMNKRYVPKFNGLTPAEYRKMAA
ncbi:IS3 family transposase [Listeria fleischmannii]|uniref:IS3 family transposase n=2 Tax=Listeria fleischmannii TaxID=1069827 RepID=A0A841YI34_9LIST|nr:IS3 family transposase [Listeria fleischmannii]MBC1399959.1 IS3 family transposase [Listeria fleischmannii]MBC1405988.1 IS3 family transposase [Listeria welshimeri]MBC1428281.1 IS3 family transposase [Listeria fleischmannii]